tara:strand:- start:978 stop:1565 length:588 start_codon:yes stop_codon:yes gene_type:complete
MQIKKLKGNSGNLIEGPLLITPEVKRDDRGYFFEAWNQKMFSSKTNFFKDFNQDNISYSNKGTIRGLHYQMKPYAQSKLVSCLHGSIYDVAVDLRKESETFGDWVGVNLNSDNFLQFWIPEGFAHGFLVTSNECKVQYKVSGYWSKNHERGISWKDDDLKIEWPIKHHDISDVKINLKDKNASSFKKIKKDGDFF